MLSKISRSQKNKYRRLCICGICGLEEHEGQRGQLDGLLAKDVSLATVLMLYWDTMTQSALLKKVFNWGLLTILEVSPRFSWQEAGRHDWSSSWEFTSCDPQTIGRRERLALGWACEMLRPTPSDTPPAKTHAPILTKHGHQPGAKNSNIWTHRGHSQSNHHWWQ